MTADSETVPAPVVHLAIRATGEPRCLVCGRAMRDWSEGDRWTRDPLLREDMLAAGPWSRCRAVQRNSPRSNQEPTA